MKVGVVSDSLAKIYKQYKVDSAAFVTACNPFGEVIDAAANNRRQTELKVALIRQGFDYFDGIGRDPAGEWMAEPSCFIPGLSLNDAKILGCSFEQNALVWCGSDAMPQLVLLR
ncbi:MAG: DUF3293 domain-containing protein [Gallionella sp.]